MKGEGVGEAGIHGRYYLLDELDGEGGRISVDEMASFLILSK